MSVDIARQESILERQIKPAALRAGIGKIGWHTYRHSHSSLLRRVGADIKVQQELLRHSTIQKHDECLYTSDARGKAGREQCGGAERIAV